MSTPEEQKAQPNPEAPNGKKKRLRSPAYPFINLEESLKKAEVIWEKEKRHPVSIPVVSVHWQYGAKSSGGNNSASAMKKFGLLIEDGSGPSRTVKLSDLALELIKNKDVPEERAKLLKIAALKPEIHRELWTNHQDASDASLRRFLVFDRKFNENAVDAVIKEYRDTVAFAKLSPSDTVPDNDEDENDTEDIKDPAPPRKEPAPPHVHPNPALEIQKNQQEVAAAKAAFTAPPQMLAPPGLMDFPVPLPSGIVAYYRLPPTITESDFNFYQTLLNAYRPGLVKSSQSFPCRAVWKNKDGDKPVTILGTMGAANGVAYYMSSDKTGIPETELEFQ